MQSNILFSKQLDVCTTCGVKYEKEYNEGVSCKICTDDRQYLIDDTQHWTSLHALQTRHAVQQVELTPELSSFTLMPNFAIGQRAFFIQSPSGNVLWDCIPLLTPPIIDFIKAAGGLQAIAFSHPHYYSNMHVWAEIFQCPIYIHQEDEPFVADSKVHIKFWSQDALDISDSVKLIHTPGHFPGSTILHTQIPSLGDTIFIGDSLYLSKDRKHLSAMHSFPNVIPLSNKETLQVFDTISPYSFDSIFGAFEFQNIFEGGREVFEASHLRYKKAFDK